VTDTITALLKRVRREEQQLQRVREQERTVLERRNATIRRLRAESVSYGQIAAALGISRSGAIGICRKFVE
jgi:DNA-binding CsgD family transcriptional regulator